MANEILDIKKFGFVLEEEADGILFFRKHFPELYFTIELEQHKNVFTLLRIDHRTEEKWEIASRYKITTQAQLDFLMLNGRLSIFFDPE